MGPDNDLLVCGDEVLSPRKVYAYAGLDSLPREVDPVRGPVDGSAWPRRDLLASSGSLFPWDSLRLSNVESANPAPETNLDTPLISAHLRHGRLFLITRSGQLITRHARSLRQLHVTDLRPVEHGVHISESLLHLTTSSQDSTTWTAFPLNKPVEPLFEHSLPLRKAQLCVRFNTFLALGTEQGQSQSLLWGAVSEAEFRPAKLRLAPDGGRGSSFVTQLGSDWVVVALDGKIYRQSVVDKEQEEPENVYSNPNRLRVVQVTTLKDERLVLLAHSPQSPRETYLIVVCSDTDGHATRVSSHRLRLADGDGEVKLVSLPQGLFAATKMVGQIIQISRLEIEEGQLRESPLLSLQGSLDHELDGLHPLPQADEWHLLLATKRDTYWQLWKVEVGSATYKLLQGQEPSGDQLAFPWESGLGLYVNLTRGRVRELLWRS